MCYSLRFQSSAKKLVSLRINNAVLFACRIIGVWVGGVGRCQLGAGFPVAASAVVERGHAFAGLAVGPGRGLYHRPMELQTAAGGDEIVDFSNHGTQPVPL